MSNHIQGVYKYGRPDAPILLINPCPTHEEMESGLPFSGRAGLLVWNALKKFGYDRTDIRIIQRVCRPAENADGNPSVQQLSDCEQHFIDDIAESKSKVVILLGGLAVRETLGIGGKIDDLNGYVIFSEEGVSREKKVYGQIGEYKTDRKCSACKGKGKTENSDPCVVCNGKKYIHKKGDPRYGTIRIEQPPRIVPSALAYIPTLHPETIRLQGYKHAFAFTTSVARAVRVVKDELDLITDDDYFEVPYACPSDVDAVAFDIETDIGTGAIERIGFSWRIKDKTVTWTSPWTPGAKEVSKRILENPRITKIAHNIMFDASHLAAHGIQVKGKWFCSMQAGAMLQPDLLKGLGRMAPLYLDIRRWKHKSKDEPAKYNALDAKIDMHLGWIQMGELEYAGMAKLNERVMSVYPTLLKMTQRGIKVNSESMEKWKEKLLSELRERQAKWALLAGSVNYLSPKQLSGYLYDKLGLPIQFNKYGRVSTDEDAIKTLVSITPKKYHARLNLLLEMRERAKQIGTYAAVATGDDGCVHPSYVPANKETTEKFGVRSGMPATGRLASSGPNIQNQTQEAKVLYVPHSPSLLLLEFDYSQLELWIVAALADDKKMLKALKGDMHAENMRILGITNRVLAKNIVYGTAYGAGPKKLSKMLRLNGIPVNELEAGAFQNRLFSEYTGWFKYRQYITELVVADKKLTNSFGRTRPFYGGKADITKALDYMPQSNGADMVWTRIVPMMESAERYGGTLLTTVHDSFLVEVDKDKVKPAVENMKNILEAEFPEIAPGFRVPVTVKIGENWGSEKVPGGKMREYKQ